ncbi:hypothetical protein COCC4DRAFT_38380 [Bipolaris maydis ATCC 48331]|uniref:EthD domain-containing protein n=2 Tax=Cochliobolus heterostrophus TaxID=5016 RepID=M2T918_COCH5|nr:uncharacterized protein COCC4DRAFT_38380 [Bipolaris maydis ATCC 48331]EMD94050.1 hypothetical protein COCHEDRAFT_1093124 [Bipolaris maydis C5]KAH7564122.1 hypothetical protein BM1_01169 [Bipolaris maydis]ENI07648.1 hypothetical protein COCC4DRAFT_38380 [Bipolaris maydis ATCC 48331]KAJ5026747.1 hypothetical protein J3E73DRAFT_369806 [Bipolaris maydis]KAJ5059514.1 hypothetical protein J3E74DRAFT_291181 [Bipolaris maydis]
MAPATVMVLYPKTATSTFDEKYYLATHMPLAAKHWTKHGLKNFKVSQLNADGPYAYSSVMEWESYEGFQAALKDPGTKEIMEDVPNFSNEKAVLLHGSVIGSG